MRHRARWIGAALAALVTAAAAALYVGDGDVEALPPGSFVVALDSHGRIGSFTDATTAPSNIAVGEGAVWVLDSEAETVARVDLATQAVKRFSAGPRPTDLAVGGGAVWVGNGAGSESFGVRVTTSISRVDPGSLKVTRTVELSRKLNAFGPPPSVGFPQMAVGAGALWAVGADNRIYRIDPATGRIVAKIPVVARVSTLAAGSDGVWFLNWSTRVDGIVIGGADETGGPLVKALRARLGPRVAIMVGDQFHVDGLLHSAERAAHGVYLATPEAVADAGSLTPAAARFAALFGTAAHRHYAINAAAAAEVVLQAIARSDGTRASVLRSLQLARGHRRHPRQLHVRPRRHLSRARDRPACHRRHAGQRAAPHLSRGHGCRARDRGAGEPLGLSPVQSAFSGEQAPRSIVDRIDRIGRLTSRRVEMFTRALLCAAGALLVSATPAHATFPGQNGKIVFARFNGLDDASTSDIYTMSPNGHHLLNLTPNSPANDDFPRWSADGRMIAFWSTRTGPGNPTGDQEIFVMNADGSGLRQVTYNTVDDGGPAWSPDGDRLVFHRWLADFSDADLMTVRVNGTDERNLTRSPGILDRYPVWSPDGREIVFMRDDSGFENDIATIRPDGSHLRALTATPTDEEAPDWSPDGQRIAFQADTAMPGEQWDIYVMRRDGGSPPTRLTTATGYHAGWSPDGRKIVFVSGLTDDVELFTMRADGSHQKQRTLHPEGWDNHPDWQPLPKGARAEEDDE